MAALAEPLLMTVEQFDALPERQDVLEEIHSGLLVALAGLKAWHVKLQMNLTQLLQPLVTGRGCIVMESIVMELAVRAAFEYDGRAADVRVRVQKDPGTKSTMATRAIPAMVPTNAWPVGPRA